MGGGQYPPNCSVPAALWVCDQSSQEFPGASPGAGALRSVVQHQDLPGLPVTGEADEVEGYNFRCYIGQLDRCDDPGQSDENVCALSLSCRLGSISFKESAIHPSPLLAFNREKHSPVSPGVTQPEERPQMMVFKIPTKQGSESLR